MVGVPIGTDPYVEECAMEKITEGGTDRLACMRARIMPDKQVAHRAVTHPETDPDISRGASATSGQDKKRL